MLSAFTKVTLSIIKWFAWIAITGWLLLTSIWLEAWHTGLIKYACMQKFTKEMNDFGTFVHHPATGILINLMLLTGLMSVASMIVYVRQESRFAKLIGFFSTFNAKNARVISFSYVFVLITCACCFGEPYSIFSWLLSWLAGSLIVVLALFLPTNDK